MQSLGQGVKIGAYAVVGEDVELGDGCVLHTHAMLTGPSKFGKEQCVLFVQCDR